MTPEKVYAAAVAQICHDRELSVVEDRTESVSGYGKPVLRVLGADGYALLRLGTTPVQAAAYRALGPSGLSPSLLAEGVTLGVPWLLAEWVEGEPIVSDLETAVLDNFAGLTVPVLRAAQGLYVAKAPGTARREIASIARELELKTLQWRVDPTPMVHLNAEEYWGDAVVLHGDLAPTNVLRKGDQSLAFIDPDGDYGPPEKDAGWWIAGMTQLALGSASSIDDLVGRASGMLAVVAEGVPSLDEARLRAWTAYALLELAWSLHGYDAPHDRCKALVSVGGTVFPNVPKGATVSVGRNAPCPCGSGRKAKRCHRHGLKS